MLLIEIKQQTNSEKVNIKKYNVAVLPLTKHIIEGGAHGQLNNQDRLW